MSAPRRLSIITKLALLSGLLILNVVATGVVSFLSSRELAADLEDAVDNDLPATRAEMMMDMMHDGISANVFHTMLLGTTGDRKARDQTAAELKEFIATMYEEIEALRKLSLPADQRAMLEAAVPNVDAYTASARRIADLVVAGKNQEAMLEMPAFQEKFEHLEKDLDIFGKAISDDAVESAKRSEEAGARDKIVTLVVSVAGIVLGLILSFVIIRGLSQSLRTVIKSLATESTTVSHSANGLSLASDSLAAATTQQANALQETAASVDEITAMVKKTSDSSKHLDLAAQDSNRAAGKGQEAIGQMLKAMSTISDANTRIVGQVEDGNLKITEIVKVIGEIGAKTTVINDIVFQTKLLSFNASVEAARAGEHGKGFAVVADEVGKLAQMSGNAAKEIAEMLTSSISTVEGIVVDSKRRVEALVAEGKEKLAFGTAVAHQCGGALEEIVKHSGDVKTMVTEIATAIQEQNQGIQEISKSIQLLDQTTHQNAKTSKETSDTSSALLEQSRTLHGIVGELEALVIGRVGTNVDGSSGTLEDSTRTGS